MIGVLVIVYGFLETIKIFDNRTINVILSFVIGFTLFYSGTFFKLVNWVFAVMGTFSVVVFGLMFFTGIWLYKRKRGAEWNTSTLISQAYEEGAKSLHDQLNGKREEYAKLMKRFAEISTRKDRRRFLIFPGSIFPGSFGQERFEITLRMRQVKKEIDQLIENIKLFKEEKELY
jgi:uncharacterized membrane protein